MCRQLKNWKTEEEVATIENKWASILFACTTNKHKHKHTLTSRVPLSGGNGQIAAVGAWKKGAVSGTRTQSVGRRVRGSGSAGRECAAMGERRQYCRQYATVVERRR